MSRRILLTGATGCLGRRLVARLLAAGHDVRALSRHPHGSDGGRSEWVVGDLRTGAGIDAAVSGVEVIVHCASAQRGDLAATQHLLDAARHTGSPHLIYISIVGVDRIPLGYYQTKLAVERLIADSSVPFTILRATQFHDLVLTMLTVQRRLPLLMVPARTSVQPVAAGEVADRLTHLAGAEPAGRVADLGGPEILAGIDVAHRYLRASGRHRLVLPVLIPGKIGRGYRDGGHLAPGNADAQVTFDQFLAARTSSASTPSQDCRSRSAV